MIELSIVVPAYNEASRLVEGVRRLSEAIAQGAVDPESTEVIVVDDGSTDGTARAAATLLVALPHHRVVQLSENRGKGAAVRAGVQTASAPAIAYMDADMAIHPDQIPALVAALGPADVAIGTRAHGSHGVVYSTRLRTLEGRAFNRAVNALTGVRLADTQCGFKAFRAPVARLLFGCSVIDRFAFDMEVLSLARRFGLRIAEVPVQWVDVPGSRIRPLRDPVSMLLDLARSRTGRHRSADLVAFELAAVEPGAVLAVLGEPGVPMLARRGGGTVVLAVPGSGGNAGGGLLESRLTAAFGAGAVGRTAMGVAQLRELAPLELLAAAPGEVGTMTECRAPGTLPPGPDQLP